jgi:hypothetical protein
VTTNKTAAKKKTVAKKSATKPEASTPKTRRVSIQGEVLTLDPDDLTIGELEDFEDTCGRSLEDLLRGEIQTDDEGNTVRDPKTNRPVRVVRPRIKEIRCLVWIAKRRTHPDFTLEQARDVKIKELQLGSDPQ